MTKKMVFVCTTFAALFFSSFVMAQFDYEASRKKFQETVNEALKTILDSEEIPMHLAEIKKSGLKRQEKFISFLSEEAINFLIKNAENLKDEFSRRNQIIENQEKALQLDDALKTIAHLKKAVLAILCNRHDFVKNIYNKKTKLRIKYKLRKREFHAVIQRLKPVFNFNPKYDGVISNCLLQELKKILAAYKEEPKYIEIESTLIKEHLLPENKRLYSSKSHLKSDLNIATEGECTICFDKATEANPLMKLERCNPHKPNYCRDCLRKHLLTAGSEYDQKERVLRCPDLSCKAIPTAGDLLYCCDIREATDLKRIYLQQFPVKSSLICSEKGCRGFLISDKKKKNVLYCPKCKVKHCSECGIYRPKGKTCAEHREYLDAQQVKVDLAPLLNIGVIQICPNCKSGIIRTTGCENVHCLCGKEMKYKGGFDDSQYAWDSVQKIIASENGATA